MLPVPGSMYMYERHRMTYFNRHWERCFYVHGQGNPISPGLIWTSNLSAGPASH